MASRLSASDTADARSALTRCGAVLHGNGTAALVRLPSPVKRWSRTNCHGATSVDNRCSAPSAPEPTVPAGETQTPTCILRRQSPMTSPGPRTANSMFATGSARSRGRTSWGGAAKPSSPGPGRPGSCRERTQRVFLRWYGRMIMKPFAISLCTSSVGRASSASMVAAENFRDSWGLSRLRCRDVAVDIGATAFQDVNNLNAIKPGGRLRLKLVRDGRPSSTPRSFVRTGVPPMS
jgi:hypothetical protein